MGMNWKEAHVPGMIKNPRSAIGTVMTPSTIKSPTRKERSEVINVGQVVTLLTLPPSETVNAIQTVVCALSGGFKRDSL